MRGDALPKPEILPPSMLPSLTTYVTAMWHLDYHYHIVLASICQFPNQALATSKSLIKTASKLYNLTNHISGQLPNPILLQLPKLFVKLVLKSCQASFQTPSATLQCWFWYHLQASSPGPDLDVQQIKVATNGQSATMVIQKSFNQSNLSLLSSSCPAIFLIPIS